MRRAVLGVGQPGLARAQRQGITAPWHRGWDGRGRAAHHVHGPAMRGESAAALWAARGLHPAGAGADALGGMGGGPGAAPQLLEDSAIEGMNFR